VTFDSLDTGIPQYCRRCGTMLVDGVCPTCAVRPPAPAPKPRLVPAARDAPAAPPPHQPPAQTAQHTPWFSSVPTPAVAGRGKGWRYVHMWNWGAFLLCPLWLMNHGRVIRAMGFLVLCVVPFTWVFAFAMAIAYGIKGNRVASISRDFVDDAQFAAVQNAWRNCGIGFALLGVLVVLLMRLVAA
jgi:hypothetical protein